MSEIKFMNNKHLLFDMERSDGFYNSEGSGTLIDNIEVDEKGKFQYKVYYRDFYAAKECSCHSETCCHNHGWSKLEYRREKVYIKSQSHD